MPQGDSDRVAVAKVQLLYNLAQPFAQWANFWRKAKHLSINLRAKVQSSFSSGGDGQWETPKPLTIQEIICNFRWGLWVIAEGLGLRQLCSLQRTALSLEECLLNIPYKQHCFFFFDKQHCQKLFLKFCITLPWVLLFLPRRNFPLPKNSYFFYFQLVLKMPEMAIDSNLYVHRLAKWQLGALHIILTWITCQSTWSHFLH